jgi:hypothetical protein
MKKARIILFSLQLLVFAVPLAASGEDLELINRPVNTSGLTGLLVTTSPFTLPQRSIEVGASVLSENSLLPKYSSISYPLTATYGIARDKELAVRAVYLYRNDDAGAKTRGVGDTQLSFKWNVLPQPEYRNRPGLAILATGIFPTGDREAGTNSVNHWGCRLGIAAGSEIVWEDRIIAIYADGQIAMQDLSDEVYRDIYTLVNTGVLFPISKYRNLQMLVEFSSRMGKDIINIDGGNFSAVTYGLRLVNEKFSFTFGTQFINKSDEGYNNSSRIIGIISVKI